MLVVYLLIAIVFIVVSTTKFKLHPFLALIFAALGYGLLSGMEFSDIVASVNNGFGNIVGYIGIVIIIGCIIGTFLEESGGAYIMARSVIRFSGEKRVPLAMLILVVYLMLTINVSVNAHLKKEFCLMPVQKYKIPWMKNVVFFM